MKKATGKQKRAILKIERRIERAVRDAQIGKTPLDRFAAEVHGKLASRAMVNLMTAILQ